MHLHTRRDEIEREDISGLERDGTEHTESTAHFWGVGGSRSTRRRDGVGLAAGKRRAVH